jgi:hypothetical protein
MRAIDAMTRVGSQSIGVEAETRLGDIQAVGRKVQLKKRDARLDVMILLVGETRGNREVLTAYREVLRNSFPLDTRSVLASLARSEAPRADGIVVL